MTNPCCCSENPTCTDEPCFEQPFQRCGPAPWFAEDLYMDIATAFLTKVKVNLGQINFRLAVPWGGFGYGCWGADDTDTCCGQFNPPSCGSSAAVTMSVGCASAFDLSNFDNVEWRAYIYAPNQFQTNCQGCAPPPDDFGYLTYGLPTVDAKWPRCFDCASRTPDQCTFTQTPMPDFYVSDPNISLVYVAGIGETLEQPAENKQPCCDIVGYADPCGFPFTPFPFREGLRFVDPPDLPTPPPTPTFRLLTIPGSPTPCEPPNYRDVYVRKQLWILPNFNENASGNCIRLLFNVKYQHTFLPIVPGVTGGSNPPPCSCTETGKCYVGPFVCTSRLAQSEAWYYMDIYGTDTLQSVLAKPLRLFRVFHGGEIDSITCGAEPQVVAALLPPFTGCSVSASGTGCEAVPTSSCPFPAPLTDCRTFPSGLAEVPCSPPQNPVYPSPPQNTHFDFPNNLFITI